MSEFEKELDELEYNTRTGGGYKLFGEPTLKRHFEHWRSLEDREKLIQKISALTIENEKLKADKPQIEILLDNTDKQLVVVPKFVAEWYEKMIIGTFSAVISSYAFNSEFESVKWVNEHGGMKLLCEMFLRGYTVEKERLYFLKNKLTQGYLYKNGGHFSECGKESMAFATFRVEFTQSEIDDMETGSYEQIAVTFEEA